MKILSQRNPLWADKKLGNSKITVGRFGCTTCSISMISDYFGCYKSPIELAGNANNYTAYGLVIWKNLKFDKMKFVKREYGENRANILAALKDPRKAVILEVGNGSHWVVAYSKPLFGNDITCADPWLGKICGAKKTYRNITGAAYFEKI